jgi:DNA-binding response OmpR family regulator
MEATQRHHILLVDDDISTIQVLWCLLSDEAQIRFAKSAEQALSLALELPPDLLLLDQMLPDASGLDVVRAFQREPTLARVPVMLITGHDAEGLESRALELGAVDFLHKPIVGEQLLARVRAQLRRLDRAPRERALVGNAGTPGRPVRVLIVDDDVVSIKMLRNLLEAEGAAVQFHFATRGDEALQLVDSVQPELVLLDAGLPRLDGLEVCRHLRLNARLRDVPVVFVTRRDDAHTEAAAFDAGASDYILKSVAPGVLRARIRAHLPRPGQPRAPGAAAASPGGPSTEEQLQALANLHGCALMLLDASWRVLFCSQAAADLLGLPVADTCGRRMRELWWSARALDADLPQVTGADATAELEALLRHGRESLSLEVVRCDGLPLRTRLEVSGAQSAAGRPVLLHWVPVQPPAAEPQALEDLLPSRAATIAGLAGRLRTEAQQLTAELAPLGPVARPALQRLAAGEVLLADLGLLIEDDPHWPPLALSAVDATAALHAAIEAARVSPAVQGGLREALDQSLTRWQTADVPPGPPVAAEPQRLVHGLARALEVCCEPASDRTPLLLQPGEDGLTLQLFPAAAQFPSVQALREACWPLGKPEPGERSPLRALRLAVVRHLLAAVGVSMSVQEHAEGAVRIDLLLPWWDPAAAGAPLLLPT